MQGSALLSFTAKKERIRSKIIFINQVVGDWPKVTKQTMGDYGKTLFNLPRHITFNHLGELLTSLIRQ
jgi:hypothetical protein